MEYVSPVKIVLSVMLANVNISATNLYVNFVAKQMLRPLKKHVSQYYVGKKLTRNAKMIVILLFHQ